jgi:hypothetical protein
MSTRTENHPQTWTRIDYAELPSTMHPKERAETLTARDLEKPIEQLLCDFHDMAERASPGRDLEEFPLQAMLHAQKRMAGMMAKVALSNEALNRTNDILQRRLYWLSIAVAILTIVSTIFGGIQAAGVLATWPK